MRIIINTNEFFNNMTTNRLLRQQNWTVQIHLNNKSQKVIQSLSLSLSVSEISTAVAAVCPSEVVACGASVCVG